MKRKQYEAKRHELMNEAEALINSGKIEEANAKMEEVKKLDAVWDGIAQAEANFKALNSDPAPAFPVSEGQMEGKEVPAKEDIVEKTLGSDVYKYAWAKVLTDRPLNRDEKEALELVNQAYFGKMTNEVHTTKNTSIVIPETISKGIWELVEEKHPYFGDVTKTYVKGILTMIQEDESSEAGWYVEGIKTEDGEETFKKYSLNGCELSRAIRVSWKLKEMAIDDFIPYIQRKMAKKMGKAIGYGMIHGKGKANENKPEPNGVVTALAAEEGTPRIMEYVGVPTYEDIVGVVAEIESGYSTGLKIYANNRTIWTKLAMIQDKNDRPIFISDPISSGIKHLLGLEVKEEAEMNDGEILFSNAGDGYHANINKELTMMTEEHVVDRVTDYAGYAIIDGNVTFMGAHALLREKSGSGSLASEPNAQSETAKTSK